MSDLTKALDQQNQAEVFEFFKQTTVAGKVVYRVPSRLAISLDVLITGAATVKVYRSNITDGTADMAMWGDALATYTISTKVVIENEPWMYWMVEVSAIVGTVSVAMGA